MSFNTQVTACEFLFAALRVHEALTGTARVVSDGRRLALVARDVAKTAAVVACVNADGAPGVSEQVAWLPLKRPRLRPRSRAEVRVSPACVALLPESGDRAELARLQGTLSLRAAQRLATAPFAAEWTMAPARLHYVLGLFAETGCEHVAVGVSAAAVVFAARSARFRHRVAFAMGKDVRVCVDAPMHARSGVFVLPPLAAATSELSRLADVCHVALSADGLFTVVVGTDATRMTLHFAAVHDAPLLNPRDLL
jgi:hypothetical protein